MNEELSTPRTRISHSRMKSINTPESALRTTARKSKIKTANSGNKRKISKKTTDEKLNTNSTIDFDCNLVGQIKRPCKLAISSTYSSVFNDSSPGQKKKKTPSFLSPTYSYNGLSVQTQSLEGSTPASKQSTKDFSPECLWTFPESGGPDLHPPISDVISQDLWSLASSWISVIGRDLTGCILSKDWNDRKKGLRSLARILAQILRSHRHPEHTPERIWRTTTEILNRLLEDKVFRVYQSSLKTLQTLLTLTHCSCYLSESDMKFLLRPLVQKILIKCSDGKKRVSNLSAAFVLELIKGESGNLAPGKHVYHEASHLKIENDYFKKLLFDNGDSLTWQWTLGVLVVIDKLFEDEGAIEIIDNYILLRSIEFSFKNLSHSHCNVSKLSRKIFVQFSKKTDARVFPYIWNSLASLDLTLQNRLKRQLRSRFESLNHEFLKNQTLSLDTACQTPPSDLIRLREQVLEQNLPYDCPSPDKTLVHPHGAVGSHTLDLSPLYSEGVHWIKGTLLGTGAYSKCYQARDSLTGALMAVKQVSLNEKNIEISLFEVELMSKIGAHPKLVKMIGATQTPGTLNIFVEWMAGGTVSRLLEIYGVIEEKIMLSYIKQVLIGLNYLHHNTVLHRDIKGANLLLDATGLQLKIGDLGAACYLTSIAPREDCRGTIAFTAPEILRGEDYGFNSDVWSVGCCIIEMATRRPPWNASDISNHLALIFKIARSLQPPEIPDNLSFGCAQLVSACLELSPYKRPSASQLLQNEIFNSFQGAI